MNENTFESGYSTARGFVPQYIASGLSANTTKSSLANMNENEIGLTTMISSYNVSEVRQKTNLSHSEAAATFRPKNHRCKFATHLQTFANNRI